MAKGFYLHDEALVVFKSQDPNRTQRLQKLLQFTRSRYDYFFFFNQELNLPNFKNFLMQNRCSTFLMPYNPRFSRFKVPDNVAVTSVSTFTVRISVQTLQVIHYLVSLKL